MEFHSRWHTLFWRLCIYVHSGSRAIALYCLLTQTEPSLIVQEKQMPPLVALVFLLD